MKYILVALILISAHIAIHHDHKRVHVYAAEYYYGDNHLNHDFQLQDD